MNCSDQCALLAVSKKKHPSMGPAQIRAQLKRFLGWRVSIKAIARVLRKAGYAPVHRKGRPVGDEHPRRFEAPHRNAIWQLDFTELRVGTERRWLLVIEDDFSRFVVAHVLADGSTSEVVVAALREAIRLHGKCDSDIVALSDREMFGAMSWLIGRRKHVIEPLPPPQSSPYSTFCSICWVSPGSPRYCSEARSMSTNCAV